MTESENENDHFDLDHFDQHFGEPAHVFLWAKMWQRRWDTANLSMQSPCM